MEVKNIGMADGGNKDDVIPSSWNYGSFHYQSRLYTSFIQKEGKKEITKKYEPLNKTNHVQKNVSDLKAGSKTGSKKAGKANRARDKLNMTQPRIKKSQTAGGQRTTKSQECPKNKIATEDYYRALKEYKLIGEKVILNSKI